MTNNHSIKNVNNTEEKKPKGHAVTRIIRNIVMRTKKKALKKFGVRLNGGVIKQGIGYKGPELKTHLEKTFTPKMNWNNYGTYWNLGHIKEFASANNIKELININHFSNLEAENKEENEAKGRYYNEVILKQNI